MTIDRPAIRSLRQNALYWSQVVQPFTEFLRQHDPRIDRQAAHELLKRRFLRRPIINCETGQLIDEQVGSTTNLNTAEFSEYIDACSKHLRECFGIVIDLPTERTEP